MMFQELLKLSNDLEENLCKSQDSLMQLLKPQLCLIGSMAERTRVGLANELDISMVFRAWKGNAPFKVGDAFSLKKSEKIVNQMPWMDKYFTEENAFDRSSFMRDILFEIEVSAEKVFGKERIMRTNKEHLDCTRCHHKGVDKEGKFKKQSKECCVFVSQSKIGICLQLLMTDKKGNKTYCSIDLIPMFEIETILDTDLAKIVNDGMLGVGHPKDCFKYLFSYCNTLQMVDIELDDSDQSMRNLTSVALKAMNCHKDRNYYVKPGQILGGKKIQHKGMQKAYCYLKAMKKILGIDVSSFWMKKMLMSRPFGHIAEGWGEGLPELILLDVLQSPEFKSRFAGVIDFDKWELKEEFWVIPLKSTQQSSHALELSLD